MINVWVVTTVDAGTKDPQDCTHVFIPAAKKLKAAYNAGYSEFHNNQPHEAGKKAFFEILEGMKGSLDFFTYFGHGSPKQLQEHILFDKDIEEFGSILRGKLNDGASVMLYSCAAGSSAGLTSMLADAIGKGVWVYGHTTYQHSFKNPSVSEVHQGDGPKWRMLTDVFGPDLQGAWGESLERTDLWLRFPLMQHADIIKELNAARLSGRWTTPNGTYTFTWPVVDGTYGTFDSLCVNPTGTVTDGTRNGTWELDDELSISWPGGAKENWPRPINPDGQTIRGVAGFAKRQAHIKYGVVQG